MRVLCGAISLAALGQFCGPGPVLRTWVRLAAPGDDRLAIGSALCTGIARRRHPFCPDATGSLPPAGKRTRVGEVSFRILYREPHRHTMSSRHGSFRRRPRLTRYLGDGLVARLLSTVGGALLVSMGLYRRGTAGGIMGAAGSLLVFRGLAGFDPINRLMGRGAVRGASTSELELKETLTINRPRHEAYQAWRDIENLPRFMKHLREVRLLGGERSHWSARLPGDAGMIEWDAKMVTDVADEMLAWRSQPGAVIANEGEVLFRDAPGGRGTEITARICYKPAAGGVGRAASKALNPVFGRMIREDLRRFKHMLEAGEIPQSEARPTRRPRAQADHTPAS